VFCGYVFWTFVSDSLTGSTGLIQSQLEFAVHNNLSVLGLFAKALVDRLFEYLMNMAVLVLMILLLRPGDFSLTLALFPVFVFLSVLASLGGSYLVNIVTILYPDMRTAVQVGARFMFFASPVFWSAEASHGARTWLVTYNPIAYYLSADARFSVCSRLNHLPGGLLGLPPRSWPELGISRLPLRRTSYGFQIRWRRLKLRM
jgi:lipopolysaccharide transport system permease protein